VEVTVTTAEDGVRVQVRDHGPGVAPDELANVGRRFWRSRRNVNVDGSGLGLSIASTLLAASGGDIRFGLAEPTGFVVTLRVPIRSEFAARLDSTGPGGGTPSADVIGGNVVGGNVVGGDVMRGDVLEGDVLEGEVVPAEVMSALVVEPSPPNPRFSADGTSAGGQTFVSR